tara:strand:+ start:2629 stop:3009 length:381 start_codon:yes stop_codon:yes gene_type:complete
MTHPTETILLDVDLTHNHTDIDWRGMRLMRFSKIVLIFENETKVTTEVMQVSQQAIRPGEIGTALLRVVQPEAHAIPELQQGASFVVESMDNAIINGQIANIRQETAADRNQQDLEQIKLDRSPRN